MRVKCGHCSREDEGRCSELKVTVKRTKSRKCDFYEFDEKKELARLELKAIAMDNQDAAFARKRKRLETQALNNNMDRFKSTAVEGEGGL